MKRSNIPCPKNVNRDGQCAEKNVVEAVVALVGENFKRLYAGISKVATVSSSLKDAEGIVKQFKDAYPDFVKAMERMKRWKS